MLTNTDINPESILKIATGFWSAKVLLSAVELGVFTTLSQTSLDAAALGERLQLHERGVRDFLDALVALGLLQREDDRYSNSPEAAQYLDHHQPTYLGGFLEMVNTRLYPSWGKLTEALRTGQPQNELNQAGQELEEDLFATLYAEPDKLKLFLGAMTGVSLPTAQVIAQKFPWQDYQTFIDIGAAQGGLPVQIALAHPHLTGGGFDLPQVQSVFDEYIARFDLQKRLKFYPGNFFTDPLPTADVLVMGHILHDWNLEEKQMLITKAFAALPPGGALLVYEALIDDERRQNAFGLMMSLNMLIETAGGFDYTGADCCQWMHSAGFSRTYVERLTSGDGMVVGIK